MPSVISSIFIMGTPLARSIPMQIPIEIQW